MIQHMITLLKKPPMRWMLAIIWTIIITILLLQPGDKPVFDPGGMLEGPESLGREIFFTTIHLIAFSMTCAIWFWTWYGHLNLTRSLLLSSGLTIIFGIVTEYLQSYASDRSPSVIDFTANCLGALLIAYLIWRKQNHIPHLTTM